MAIFILKWSSDVPHVWEALISCSTKFVPNLVSQCAHYFFNFQKHIFFCEIYFDKLLCEYYVGFWWLKKCERVETSNVNLCECYGKDLTRRYVLILGLERKVCGYDLHDRTHFF